MQHNNVFWWNSAAVWSEATSRKPLITPGWTYQQPFMFLCPRWRNCMRSFRFALLWDAEKCARLTKKETNGAWEGKKLNPGCSWTLIHFSLTQQRDDEAARITSADDNHGNRGAAHGKKIREIAREQDGHSHTRFGGGLFKRADLRLCIV